jgi:hypothetical protein
MPINYFQNLLKRQPISLKGNIKIQIKGKKIHPNIVTVISRPRIALSIIQTGQIIEQLYLGFLAILLIPSR